MGRSWLKNYFQITPQDDERRRREQVTGKVLTLDRSLEDTLPSLLALLSVSDPAAALQQMDPQLRRRRTFEALTRLLLRESLNQPLLLVVEDLHWLDNETQAWLNVMSERVATARLLLLVNYRPEYQHTWASKTFYTQLRLDPLGPEEAHELLTTLLGDAASLQALQQSILARTEGNPFFMEEIVQTLVDQGALVREAGTGTPHTVARLTRPLTGIQLPPTVQGVLAARMDRLGTAMRQSCIGSRGSYCCGPTSNVQRRAHAPGPVLRGHGGRGLFSSGSRGGPPPGGEVVGAARGAEPEPAVAASGQACRSPPATVGDLRLVHRGL